MKKISKKMALAGSSIFFTVPLAALISCGANPDNKDFESPDLSSAHALKLDSVDLSELKTEAMNAGINKTDIEGINIDDLQKYRLGDSTIDPQKKTLIKKMENVLINYSFVNNQKKKEIGELQKWVNNSSLAIYNSQSPGRGPWRSKESEGASSYYRNDFVSLRMVNDFTGYDLVGSKFVSGSNFKSDRFINTFNSVSSPKKGDRIFDHNLITGNTFGSSETSGASFSIYRSEASGKYDYTVNASNGKKTWTSSEKITNKLFKGLSIDIDGQKPTDNTLESATTLSNTINNKNATITISTNTSSSVNYAKANNGNVVDSNVQFRAKDLFYGLVRNLYASKDFRNTGKINGVDLSTLLTPFSKTDKTAWNNLFASDDAANSYDNKNTYLFDLYGVDLLATIQANMGNNNDEDKFVIKYKNFAPTSLEMFKNNAEFSPFSKTLMDSSVGQSQSISNFTAQKLSIFTYGNPYSGKGKINTDGILSIAPFLFTDYSTSEGDTIVVKQNPFYVDQSWINNPLSIKGYSKEMKSQGADPSAFAQARLNGFKDAATTQEYILEASVKNFNTLLSQLAKYKIYKKPLRNGISSAAALSWNFYGFGDSSYNSLGKKMIWGSDSDIKTNPSSVSTFFSGNGAKVRASINSAVNWYAMAQTLLPGQNKEFYPGIAFDDEFKHSKLDPAMANPNYMSSTDDLKSIYEKNMQNRYKAWTPSTVASAAKTLDEIAQKVGATKDNQAQIGIFSYVFSDAPATPVVKETNSLILKILNKLSPKVKFVNQKEYSWSDFIAHANRKKDAATIIFGYKPDYSGLGSINQQWLSEYGTFGLDALFRDAFDIKSS